MYFLKDQYSKNLTEVTSAKNADGLSGMDKLEMNLNKIDEGLIVFCNVNIKREIKRIIRDNDFEISEDEIQYYMKNLNITELHENIVFSYWCKYFGSYRNTKLISKRNYIILLLILKKRLLLEAGYSHGANTVNECALPYILTGNVLDNINKRVIRNAKFNSKVDESYLYDKLKSEKYKNLFNIKPDYIHGLLSQFINTTFTYVVYENQELLGKEIDFDEDRISDELLFFLNSI